MLISTVFYMIKLTVTVKCCYLRSLTDSVEQSCTQKTVSYAAVQEIPDLL
jgi:hypothetical protein